MSNLTPDLQATAARMISRAATSLVISQEFFASLLLRLPITSSTERKTMWTNGRQIWYNPSFVVRHTHDEVVGVLAHEVGHVILGHPWRRGSRDPSEWNKACDRALNQILHECGFVLPKSALPGVPGKVAEELYQPPDSSDGDEEPDAQGDSPSGSGAAGSGDSGDGEDTDPGGCGEVIDATGDLGEPLTEAERAHQLQELQIAVTQALMAAKRAGNVPAGLAVWLDDLKAPKAPMREIVHQFVDGFSRNDYNWSRPNPRFLHGGFILPSMHQPEIGNFVLACDTSGSVVDQVGDIAAEVLGALELYVESGREPELTVAWFDTVVYPQVVSDVKDLNPQGGGGTSYRAVFEWLATHDAEPVGIVIVTDGHCADFGKAPDIPVLWILTATNHHFKPPFGTVAHVLNSPYGEVS